MQQLRYDVQTKYYEYDPSYYIILQLCDIALSKKTDILLDNEIKTITKTLSEFIDVCHTLKWNKQFDDYYEQNNNTYEKKSTIAQNILNDISEKNYATITNMLAYSDSKQTTIKHILKMKKELVSKHRIACRLCYEYADQYNF
jgi:hypothetical protein